MSHRTEPSHPEHGSVEGPSFRGQVAAGQQTHEDQFSAGQPIEIRLRLDPPELGLVRVHLRLTDEAVSVRFIAGDEAATRILQSQLPDLRQSLAERGLASAHCDVSYESGQQQQSPFGRDADPAGSLPPLTSSRGWSQPSWKPRPIVPIPLRTDRLDVMA